MCSRRFGQVVVLMALLGAVPAESQPISAPVKLSVGARLTRSLEGAAADRLIVTLTPGQFVKVVVMQTGSDVVVTLRDPQDRVLMTSDLPNGMFGAETLAAVAASGGDHVVEVKLGNPRSPKGSYDVTLEAAREATPEDRELASAYQAFTEALVLLTKRTPDARRQAIGLVDRIRPSFAKARDLYYEAWAVRMKGSMLADSGDISEALRYAEESAGLFHEARDPRGEAVAHNNAGGMLDILGEPQRALDAYRRALALQRTIGNPAEEARVLNNIGKLETDAGNWQAALDNYQRALPLARDAGDLRLQGLLTHNIGYVHGRLGDFDEALAMYQQALPLRRSARDRIGEASTLQVMGNLYRSWKQPDKSLTYLDQALSMFTGMGDRRKEAEIRINMGRAYADTGQLKAAEESIRKAVDGGRAAQDRRNTAMALLELSRVLLTEGRAADAVASAEEALTEVRAVGDRPSEANALECIARAESGLRNLAAARERMEEALRLTEDSRTRADSEQFRASFFATRQDSFTFYIDLLMRLGDRNAAFEASERARARSLLDMLAESGADIREGVDPKLLARERDLNSLLNAKGARLLPLMGRDTPQAAALKEEIRALEKEYADAQAAIRKSNPRYGALTPAPLQVKQIQEQVLDADSVLLQYSLGEERSYLWAVSRESVAAWELPARNRIEAQVAEVYALITARSAARRMETPAERQKRIEQADGALPEASRKLTAMVIAPAASAIQGKRLVIVPDGALQRLPFAMLPIPGSAEPLVSAHEVVMLPSASALAVLRADVAGRKPAPKTLAVFADPVFDSADTAQAPGSTRILAQLADPDAVDSAALKIPRLPYTAQEADQILRVAGDSSNWKATGFQATRAAAIGGQLSQYRYVHFATHGILDTERPGLSGLVLSQIDENRRPLDGFLRVNDIYNIRLSADLVVLSACQTGLGKEVRGEGLMGLTRAFLYAGASRVVVSLWNVNDRATASLMAAFYREMLRNGKRPSEALREAQLSLRKQKRWESPFYWAAFVQHGDWK